MIPIKVGMVLGVVMVMAALCSAAPGFIYPKCASDNGATCAANGCWIDESTRVKAAWPATGGQVEVVIFSESLGLSICYQNAQQTQYTCTMDPNPTTCPGARWVSVYPSPGTECQENNPPVPPNASSLTFVNNNGKDFDTCH